MPRGGCRHAKAEIFMHVFTRLPDAYYSLARSAYSFACACECCIAIPHIHIATRTGPDTPDKYLHMGLRGNFLKTQVSRWFLHRRPPLPNRTSFRGAVVYISPISPEKENGRRIKEGDRQICDAPKTLPLENPRGDRAMSLETVRGT